MAPSVDQLSHAHHTVAKRIVVCCDGTWQDGVVQKHRWQYSNVLKISRILNHQDNRLTPPTPQVVFYQAGVGSEHNFYSEYIEGATGASLAEKVQEAYAFIAHNFQSGDEIFLFGFSRGAYTARMVAAFIASHPRQGEIGVLDKKDMDHFADIFIAYQKRGKATDPKEIAGYDKVLQPFNNPHAEGRTRADADGDTFTIKCVGVFDTVGSLGLPEELTFSSKRIKDLFGFSDKRLGSHVQHAFHAMALNETRADFNVAKFEQTPEGRAKGQVLKQVWFAGSHSDIGGGWESHDLSDLSLAWMVSNIEKMLSLDRTYLDSLPRPVAPWGQQLPHDPATGVFKLATEIQRTLPTQTDEITHEMVHPSVLYQTIKLPQLMDNVKANPSLVARLLETEEIIKTHWKYDPSQSVLTGDEAKKELKSQESMKKSLEKMVKKAENREMTTEVMVDEGGRPRYTQSWLGSIIHELMES
ncbi:hypothetical protein JB92DRAFT_3277272 [Gautieria morchelliformis]|nr:hypothetical protein JB92DRAFT_3277272 [Gautieria morchelliformis]